jgi:hypothetical protein
MSNSLWFVVLIEVLKELRRPDLRALGQPVQGLLPSLTRVGRGQIELSAVAG